MRTRRRAREVAVQALYQFDSCDDWSDQLLDLFFTRFVDPDQGDHTEDNLRFCRAAIAGVAQRLSFIDQIINESSIHWQVARMSRVDRNILRLSVYEICFEPDIPPSVSINEGIELAKRFGADDSPNFINGVLDKVARTVAAQPERVENEPAAVGGLKLASNH